MSQYPDFFQIHTTKNYLRKLREVVQESLLLITLLPNCKAIYGPALF